MIRQLIKLGLRNRKLSQFCKSCYDDIRREKCAATSPETTVPEASAIQCRISNFRDQRLNLLVPALSIQYVFGGISTALQFFSYLSEDFKNVRIVLTDQHDFVYSDNPAFSNWGIAGLEDHDLPGLWIVPAANRYGRSLSVGSGDRFVATAWWTAISARAIQSWQRSVYEFPLSPIFVYLIQDYEPGFYPWSSRYALAESTYHNNENMVAVFNTGLLKSFFDNEGYQFLFHYTFEPKLNSQLLDMRQAALKQVRSQRVLIYGRPGVARNAFEVIVMGLRLWVSHNPDSSWDFVSAGELHAPVDLGNGKSLRSLGKLTLDEYAMELGCCRIGISLMISPHPSYPPLEMAAFGMQVITNRYKSKNLSLLSSNIFSIESVSPDEIFLALDQLMKPSELSAERNSMSVDPVLCKYLEEMSCFNEIRNPILGRIYPIMSNS